MPRFFFDLCSPMRTEVDEDGAEFGTLELAFLDAFRAAREIGYEMIELRCDPMLHSFVIRDHHGTLMELPFCEALGVPGEHPRMRFLKASSHHRRATSIALRAEVVREIKKTGEALAALRSTLQRLAIFTDRAKH